MADSRSLTAEGFLRPKLVWQVILREMASLGTLLGRLMPPRRTGEAFDEAPALRFLDVALDAQHIAPVWFVLPDGGGGGVRSFPRAVPGPTSAAAEIPNPILVSCNQEEVVWERTVDVIHDFFDISRENRLDGVIETLPKVGASVMEPWHRDTVGWYNRWESTFQSIRRRAFVRIVRGEGGFLVSVEVFKELEDIGVASNKASGGATFRQPLPIQNDLNLVEGRSVPSGWISQGRDPLAEQRMLKALTKGFRGLEAQREPD